MEHSKQLKNQGLANLRVISSPLPGTSPLPTNCRLPARRHGIGMFFKKVAKQEMTQTLTTGQGESRMIE